MKIGIISDHHGYELKNKIKKELSNVDFVDLGTNKKGNVDYTDYAFKLGEKVSTKQLDYGIAICGSGIGMSIACNKVKGIRCARVTSIKDVRATRNDNDANIIAFGSNISIKRAKRLIEEFINTPFSKEERHNRRVNKIKEYELNN